MTLAEKEAKTKWCHRTIGICADFGNGPPYAEKCVGSACMAWRWDVADPETYDVGNAHGHCGLAGGHWYTRDGEPA